MKKTQIESKKIDSIIYLNKLSFHSMHFISLLTLFNTTNKFVF